MSLGRIAPEEEKSQTLLEVYKDPEEQLCVGCYASHITVVLSKAAHSGPSVCLEREPPAHFAYLVPERTAPCASVPPWVQDTPYWLSQILSRYLIYLLLRSGGGVEAAASLSPLTFFFVDTCPHEYLKRLLLHPLAQVIECASGEAEEAMS
jgi:hypothetical protein